MGFDFRSTCGKKDYFFFVFVLTPSGQVRGHSKMTSLEKHQILDPPPPYITVSHFFHYISSFLCHQANSEKFSIDQVF